MNAFPSSLAPSNGPAGIEGFLNQFRDYVFGRDARAEARRKETQRQQGLAREALSSGQIQPLEDIVRNLRGTISGDLLSARLERERSGAWIYKLVLLSASGRYRHVVVDAQKNVILKLSE
jgi:uncharacterized membrane protein YkoI